MSKDIRVILDYWTIIMVLILAALTTCIFLGPSVFLIPTIPGEVSFTGIVTAVILLFVAVLFVVYKLTKALKTQIMLVLIRSFLGWILPISLAILAVSLWTKVIAIVLVVVSLVLFYYVYKLVAMLNKFAKQATQQPEPAKGKAKGKGKKKG
jgi:hypothetical protein